MKVSEFKIKIINWLNRTIDTYFGSDNISDKFLNATLKILVTQNQNKYDDILNVFADENGEIDEELIVDKYSEAIGNGFIFDIRDYIKNDLIRSMLPNKALKITRDDMLGLLG